MGSGKSLVQKNFNLRLKRAGCYVYYSGVDWLTLRLPAESRFFAVLQGLSLNSDTYHLPSLPFRLVYRGFVSGDSFKLYDLTDGKEKLGQVKIRNVNSESYGLKKNKNEPSNLQLDGVYWTCYKWSFSALMEWAGISMDEPGLIIRLDYCSDIAGLSADTLYRNRRTDKKVFSASTSPIYTDEGTGDVMAKTLYLDKGEVAFYDKKRDILQKGKEKLVMVDGSIPFAHYLHCPFPVVRIECRWTSHSWYRKKSYASLNYALDRVESDFRDWVLDYYAFDLSFFSSVVKPVRITTDKPNDLVLSDKLEFNLKMLRAYLRNCKELMGDVPLKEEIREVLGWVPHVPGLVTDHRKSQYYKRYLSRSFMSSVDLLDFVEKNIEGITGEG